jgi:hypothetical protein
MLPYAKGNVFILYSPPNSRLNLHFWFLRIPQRDR